MTNLKEITPMMKQWQACKKDAGDALLLFQLGDFYECFFDDAKIIADTLMITLTKRAETPMAGIPLQSLENYLEKLIANGLSVAIAEQGMAPADGKGIVERSVTRIVTPATYTSNKHQNSGSNNFLLCISVINQSYAIAYIDISTSEFFTSSFSTTEKMKEEILRIKPKELLLCSKLEAKKPKFLAEIGSEIETKFIKINPFYFDHKLSIEKLQGLLKVASLDGFGLKGETAAINASGALCYYLENDIFFNTSIISSINKRNTEGHLALDHSTLSHLEIFESRSGYSLFNVLNHTKTAMGSRLLKNTIFYPLKEKSAILKRQDSIKELLDGSIDLSSCLSGIKDLERLETKIAGKSSSPGDLILLAESLEKIPAIIRELNGALTIFTSNFSPLPISKEIIDTIEIDNSDYFIKENIHEKLDDLKSLEKQSAGHLKAYEERCKDTLGIKSLKVGWSRSFGYFIEISKKATHLIPDSFTRKQTLVNGERYITKELKDLESKILSAKEQAMAIEHEIFEGLVSKCIKNQRSILCAASLIARIDLIHSLKVTAVEESYICPEIVEDGSFDIEEGSHPILLKLMKDEMFIPNDILLTKEKSTAILTGPNMAGKSTYIKSIALLSILTQIGSFIPAKSARVCLVDKIFTRIGALDDLQRGQSTFMVEMTETANILRNATENSLIILDEIGRGTSTFDGIALAKSIAVYITEHIKAKTLFATHYLELTELAKDYSQIKNIRSTVLENGEEITFLHKIEEGEADQSYGIFVGSLAGLPRRVILDAKAHLKDLNPEDTPSEERKPKRKNIQYNLFLDEQVDPIVEEIKVLDTDHLSPFEALQKLLQWKKSLI